MKAMILAAGRGERMRDLTNTCPKPLLKIYDKPLIIWHIERLVENGIHEIIINISYLGEMIKDTLGNGEQYGAKLFFSEETERLETAGGIKKALPLIGDDTFLVLNADIWCDYPYRNLKSLKSDTLAHLVMVENPIHNPEGDFSLQNDFLSNETSGKFTYSGIGIYHSNLFSSITTGQKAPLAPLLKKAINAHQISGEIYKGEWLDIGTPERLLQIRKRFNPDKIRV